MLNKLQELAKLWRDLTGNNDILSMSPEDLEVIISKMDFKTQITSTSNKHHIYDNYIEVKV